MVSRTEPVVALSEYEWFDSRRGPCGMPHSFADISTKHSVRARRRVARIYTRRSASDSIWILVMIYKLAALGTFFSEQRRSERVLSTIGSPVLKGARQRSRLGELLSVSHFLFSRVLREGWRWIMTITITPTRAESICRIRLKLPKTKGPPTSTITERVATRFTRG